MASNQFQILNEVTTKFVGKQVKKGSFGNLSENLEKLKANPQNRVIQKNFIKSVWSHLRSYYSNKVSFDDFESIVQDTSNKVITGQLNPSTTGSTPQPLFNMSNAYYRGPVDIEDSLVIGLFNLDPNVDDVVQSVYSNQAGFFKFVNVDVGSYRIHPDIAGIPVKDTLTINIYATSDSADVTFEVADSMIYPAASVIVTTDVRSDIELLLWPNPVVEGVNIRAPFIIEKLELFDIMSRKIKTVFTDANEVHLVMQGLPSGIYIMYEHII